MQDLLRQRGADSPGNGAGVPTGSESADGEPTSPTIQPTRESDVRYVPSRMGAPADQVDLDASVLGPMPGQAQPRLLREGSFVVDRVGRLMQLGDRSERVIVFENAGDAPTLPPMLVMPSRYLASMEAADERSAGSAMWFRLSGQVSVYRGVNYLMVTALSGLRAGPADTSGNQPAAGGEPESGQTEAGSEGAGVNGGADPLGPAVFDGGEASNNGGQETGDETGARDEAGAGSGLGSLGEESARLVRELLQRRDAQAVDTLPAVPGGSDGGRPEVAGIAPGLTDDDGPAMRREGTILVNRTGRLRRSADGAEVLLVFDADSSTASEPPVIVQPCRMLAEMEDLVAERGRSVRLIVSGDLQQYRGANYLMPSMIKVAVDQGNLSP